MAERFKFPSVHQFAVEIVRGNSSRRLAWLREFYTSLNLPDLANAVANNFPQADSAQTSSSTATSPSAFSSTARSRREPKHTEKNPQPRTKPEPPRNEHPEPQAKPRVPRNDVLSDQKRQKFAKKNVREPLRDVVSLESEEREEEEAACSARGHRRRQRGSVSRSGAGGGGLGSHRASSSGLGSGEATAFHNGADRRIPSSADLSHGGSTTLSKPAAQEGEKDPRTSSRTSEPFRGQRTNFQTCPLPPPPPPPQRAESASSRRSLLTDLIGDTSILDDLLKPKPRGAQRRGAAESPHPTEITPTAYFTAPSPSRVPHQVVPKGGRKDFWDILNEGNEESINRLTDPAEVQRVCINTNFAARGRSEEEERKSLWKTNDKFLWKK
ncbi:DNA excision repair protein ERCC-6-like 2 [Liparis tanakae]|uniref:DNA excision repair protein ERCC-6-like 2 n=1 Tax=Liparis tanakae TaxID=230148 RepID=A0A4Z2HHY0_9TELE|nr:DNA excision repair protein ERCC-6-like 2 [Liparis tanakae]